MAGLLPFCEGDVASPERRSPDYGPHCLPVVGGPSVGAGVCRLGTAPCSAELSSPAVGERGEEADGQHSGHADQCGDQLPAQGEWGRRAAPGLTRPLAQGPVLEPRCGPRASASLENGLNLAVPGRVGGAVAHAGDDLLYPGPGLPGFC